jgi:hypothetical protein
MGLSPIQTRTVFSKRGIPFHRFAKRNSRLSQAIASKYSGYGHRGLDANVPNPSLLPEVPLDVHTRCPEVFGISDAPACHTNGFPYFLHNAIGFGVLVISGIRPTSDRPGDAGSVDDVAKHHADQSSP